MLIQTVHHCVQITSDHLTGILHILSQNISFIIIEILTIASESNTPDRFPF